MYLDLLSDLLNLLFAAKSVAVNFIFTGLALILTQVNFNLFRGISVDCPASVAGFLGNGLLGKLFCLSSLQASSSNSASSVVDGASSGMVESAELGAPETLSSATVLKPPTTSDWSLVATFVDRLLFCTYAVVVFIYHW